MTVLTRDQVLRAVHNCQLHSPDGTARTSDLAQRLGIKGPSATARVQELAAAGLVRYAPRLGAVLTEEGERQAQEAFGKLRCIERFLEAVFNLQPEVCGVEAEHLLRHISAVVMEAITKHVGSCDANRVGGS